MERKILAETNCKIKLTNQIILFGIDSEHVKEQTTHINNLILIGKMCVSIFKKTKSSFPIDLIFERELGLRNTH